MYALSLLTGMTEEEGQMYALLLLTGMTLFLRSSFVAKELCLPQTLIFYTIYHCNLMS